MIRTIKGTRVRSGSRQHPGPVRRPISPSVGGFVTALAVDEPHRIISVRRNPGGSAWQIMPVDTLLTAVATGVLPGNRG